MNIQDQLNEVINNFQNKYGSDLAMRANLLTINKMLINRGRGEEILKNLKEVINEFENKEDKEK